MRIKSKTNKVIESGIEYDVITYVDGDIRWLYDGYLHRVDGPACEKNNKKLWYLWGDLVYGYEHDYTAEFEMSDKMAMGIIKYRLSRE